MTDIFSFYMFPKDTKMHIFNESFLNVRVERRHDISCFDYSQSIHAKEEIKHIPYR